MAGLGSAGNGMVRHGAAWIQPVVIERRRRVMRCVWLRLGREWSGMDGQCRDWCDWAWIGWVGKGSEWHGFNLSSSKGGGRESLRPAWVGLGVLRQDGIGSGGVWQGLLCFGMEWTPFRGRKAAGRNQSRRGAAGLGWVRHGAERCGMVRRGLAWRGAAWRGLVRPGVDAAFLHRKVLGGNVETFAPRANKQANERPADAPAGVMK